MEACLPLSLQQRISIMINHRFISSLRPFFLCLFAGLLPLSALAQEDAVQADFSDYYAEDYLRNQDHIYVSNIKTVMLHRLGWELSYPYIELGTEEKLHFSFDDLDGGYKEYKYTLVHCDAGWQTSDLRPSDYLEGFYEDFITDYFPSYNTLESFTHYQLVFPTPEMRPLLSGNYILQVYMAGDPEKVLISMRFMIFENRLRIDGRVHAATDIQERPYRQEIDFQIDQTTYPMDQPYRNLRVVVQQNGRWDNAITDLKPMMVKGNILDYNHDYGNVFDGLNEFRRFDLKSLRYAGENIAEIREEGYDYIVRLKRDLRRPFQQYSLDRDLNGKRFIKSNEATDSRTEAEYVWVDFQLAYDAPLVNGNVYVLGGLTYWQLNEASKMVYDAKNKTYRSRLYLKQGYYNYVYAFLEDGQQAADVAFIEGTHEETENDYTILVYYRETGSRYDRLVGLTQLNSLQDR